MLNTNHLNFNLNGRKTVVGKSRRWDSRKLVWRCRVNVVCLRNTEKAGVTRDQGMGWECHHRMRMKIIRS